MVVGSNLAKGKIFTEYIGSVDSLYLSYIYIYYVYMFYVIERICDNSFRCPKPYVGVRQPVYALAHAS